VFFFYLSFVMLSQETDFMCASFISGCAVSYATLCLFNHFRLSDDERRKIGMLNCLLDRVKLELEIREFDAKLLQNKELENDTQDKLCAVRIEIGKLEDEKDKVIENLEDNMDVDDMDVDDMQNQDPVEDMMDIDKPEHVNESVQEPEDDPMEEIGLDSDEDEEEKNHVEKANEEEHQEDSDEDEENQEDSDSEHDEDSDSEHDEDSDSEHDEDSDSEHDENEDEEEEKPAVWPLDLCVRDYKLNKLRDKEEELLEQLVTYQDLIEEQTIELEEMRERYDTLSEISTMEACGINFKTVLECKLEEKNALIQELRHQIKCKDDLIQRLEGRSGAD
jgi:hypothetical protein